MARIRRIDHVAIAVKNVDQATQQFVKLLNARHIRTDNIQEKAGPVRVAYIQVGENILSLIQSLEEDGFVNKHIAKFGEGMHHLGLEVDDLDEFVRETETKGFTIPLRDDFTNRKEVVLRPKDASGVVLQVVEWKGGWDVSLEDRIQRILALQNIPPKT
jgi:methylmalonyl-CoA/ethylmalonyl-CoA epimerase